ncbi:MAG TPA: hypothetical protein VE988_09495 [Gemmataceae bacterium]|nr:hypothetical protein [Gemmataceae bacterium]
MTKFTHGKIRGQTIELTENLGLVDGQEVEVSVRTLPIGPARKKGDGLLSTEGALADDPHWDAIMEEIYQERKKDSRRESLE